MRYAESLKTLLIWIVCFTKTQGLYSNVNVCIVCCDKARLFTWYSLLLKYKIGNVQTMGVQLHENIHDLLVVDLSSIVNVYMFIRARRMRAWLLPSMIVTTFSRRLMVEKLLSHSQLVMLSPISTERKDSREPLFIAPATSTSHTGRWIGWRKVTCLQFWASYWSSIPLPNLDGLKVEWQECDDSTLEIINGTHPDLEKFEPKYTEGWDSGTKRDATSNLKAFTGIGFRICPQKYTP